MWLFEVDYVGTSWIRFSLFGPIKFLHRVVVMLGLFGHNFGSLELLYLTLLGNMSVVLRVQSCSVWPF